MKNKKVFIIDDDAEIAKLLNLALSKNGFDVKTAGDHKEAFAVLNGGYNPELILMDYYLPEVDGATLSALLFEKGIKTPVVFFHGGRC